LNVKNPLFCFIVFRQDWQLNVNKLQALQTTQIKQTRYFSLSNTSFFNLKVFLKKKENWFSKSFLIKEFFLRRLKKNG